MSDDHQRLFYILYHPMSYTHRTHLPPCWEKNEKRHELLLNYWLHINRRLEDLPENWKPKDTLMEALLNQWNHLPDIAYFIGGYLLKSSMQKNNLTLISDPKLLDFIALPMTHHVEIMQLKPRKHMLVAWGAAFILNQCHSIPLALQQRFMLLLPCDIEIPELCIPATPDHINLFNMAIHYANSFPRQAA